MNITGEILAFEAGKGAFNAVNHYGGSAGGETYGMASISFDASRKWTGETYILYIDKVLNLKYNNIQARKK